jgi:hypothetical protein
MNEFTGETLPLSELQHPMLSNAYDYWRRAKGDREFPSRKDIWPEDMKAYLSRLTLVDVSYKPLDFVYRVFGSGLAELVGKEYTGKSVRKLEPGEFGNLVWRQYVEVVNERKPCLHGVTFSAGTKYFKYQRLTLPLSSDSAVIDKLLAVSIEDQKFWGAIAEAKVVRAVGA